MYSLYGHPINFKFKRKYQQWGLCFQTIFPFLMTMMLSITTLVFILHNKELGKPNLKSSSSNPEGNNKEQVTGHSKDNANINNVNDKFEISFNTNCISDNIENINSSAKKNTGNMKEKVNNNVDIRTEEKIICNVFENSKKAAVEKI